MDNVGIVVEDLDAAIEFFTELGLTLEGRAPIEGDWAGDVTGLRGQRVEIAMMRTPDGHGRIELSRFLAPPVVADHRKAPVNALGVLRWPGSVKRTASEVRVERGRWTAGFSDALAALQGKGEGGSPCERWLAFPQGAPNRGSQQGR